MLVSKLTDSDGEATETQGWLDFALDCGYMSQDNGDRLKAGYEEVWENVVRNDGASREVRAGPATTIVYYY